VVGVPLGKLATHPVLPLGNVDLASTQGVAGVDDGLVPGGQIPLVLGVLALLGKHRLDLGRKLVPGVKLDAALHRPVNLAVLTDEAHDVTPTGPAVRAVGGRVRITRPVIFAIHNGDDLRQSRDWIDRIHGATLARPGRSVNDNYLTTSTQIA